MMTRLPHPTFRQLLLASWSRLPALAREKMRLWVMTSIARFVSDRAGKGGRVLFENIRNSDQKPITEWSDDELWNTLADITAGRVKA